MADASGGIPPRMPRRPVVGSIASALRPFRHRLRQTAEAIDRGRQGSQRDTARELVQVFDGGSIPTQPDRVFLTHPVVVDCEDSEGAVPTFTPDTSQTIPVIFVRGAPAAGDYAVAHAIAGRWVAEKGKSKKNTCQGCDETIRTVTLSWTAAPDAGQCGFGRVVGDGSVPFRIWDADTERCDNGGPTLCTNSIGPAHASLLCDGAGNIYLGVANSCPDSTQHCSIAPDPGFTCSPIFMTFTVPPSAGWCYSFWRTFTITE